MRRLPLKKLSHVTKYCTCQKKLPSNIIAISANTALATKSNTSTSHQLHQTLAQHHFSFTKNCQCYEKSHLFLDWTIPWLFLDYPGLFLGGTIPWPFLDWTIPWLFLEASISWRNYSLTSWVIYFSIGRIHEWSVSLLIYVVGDLVHYWSILWVICLFY